MNSGKNFKRTKFACYTSYFTMSSIFCVPPMLFVTMHSMYGVSYTLLGTLVLVNFFTQLAVDLFFTFTKKKFNIQRILRVMPLITALGMAVYALVPTLLPQCAYLGLALGTVIFSVSAGLSEVLLSPTIAAIPSDNPQRDMSTLHSLYAFGVLTMVLISTLFLRLFGSENWMYLMLFLAALPVIPAVLFMTSPIPELDTKVENAPSQGKKRTLSLLLCLGCIFFGSCAENTMSNWISGYMEKALQIDKTLGDICGPALFAVLLGLVRIGYARFGKNIGRVLLVGMIGATACYLVAGLVTNPIVALISCAVTGLFTSMLWPGTLILMEENIPGAGVTAFALMASGGDFGAGMAPQLMGIVVDQVSAGSMAQKLSLSTGLTTEQIGMKAGMLLSALFPIIGIVLVTITLRYFKKHKQ